MQTAPIRVSGLKKDYGSLAAIRGIDLRAEEGQILGLLGPNGAGKTTVVEILEGLRPRTSGEVSVLGFDPAKNARELRSRIGVCLQDTNFADRAKVLEVARLFAACYPRHDDPSALLKRMDLWDKRDAYCATLSGGQRQRLALALTLINDPQLIFLDEPTAGLDPFARRAIHEILRELRREGRTILLTTHQIGEADQICDQIAILNRGLIAAAGTPLDLRISGGAFADLITVRCSPEPSPERLAAWPDAVLDISRAGGAMLRISSNDAARTMAELVQWAQQNQYALNDLEVHRNSLEDVFLELTATGGVA